MPLAARVSTIDLKCVGDIPGDDSRVHGWTLLVSAVEGRKPPVRRAYRWRFVYVESVWRLMAPVRHWEHLIGVGMCMLNPFDAKRHPSHTWNLLQVKVCTCRGSLTHKATCQELRISYSRQYGECTRWKCRKMRGISPSLIEISSYEDKWHP